MIIALTAMSFTCVAPISQRGTSDSARYVVARAAEIWKGVDSAFSLAGTKREAMQELCGIFEQCQTPDWDGYGALPVEAATYQDAYRFLESLPPGLPMPSVGAEPDGQLTLEWHREARRTLSASISAEGEVHYAALLGARKAFGTEPFYGEVPAVILALIRSVAAFVR